MEKKGDRCKERGEGWKGKGKDGKKRGEGWKGKRR
jgi:hypothetical protein